MSGRPFYSPSSKFNNGWLIEPLIVSGSDTAADCSRVDWRDRACIMRNGHLHPVLGRPANLTTTEGETQVVDLRVISLSQKIEWNEQLDYRTLPRILYLPNIQMVAYLISQSLIPNVRYSSELFGSYQRDVTLLTSEQQFLSRELTWRPNKQVDESRSKWFDYLP